MPEVGSACAMAAAAYGWVLELNNSLIEYAAEMGLEHNLGLTCDPVAGLVEVPCVKRNASGAANALIAAEMALAGIESTIPVDEVIGAMKAIGDAMPKSLKETAEGGLAATPTAKKIAREILH